MPPIITLTTDFGLQDEYVAVMKGVILGICPDSTIVDLTHNIKQHSISDASLTLAGAYKYFPANAIHVCVVDPGVGSERRPIVIKSKDNYFVGPDNGVFSKVSVLEPEIRIRQIEDTSLRLPVISNTFHGRDLFAPTAAKLATGFLFDDVGSEINEIVTIESVDASISKAGTVNGAITHIDSFGNAVTNISRALVSEAFAGGVRVSVKVGDYRLGPVVSHYAAVPKGAAGVTYGSWDTLELFVRNGSAKVKMNLSVNDAVEAIRQ